MRVKSINNGCRRRREAGVTMVEALVSMAAFGISFVSLYAGLGMGFATIGSARENLRATQVMVEKMETIRLYTFKQINTPGFIPKTFTESYYAAGGGLVYNGQLAISDGPNSRSYNAYVKRVNISVSWMSGGRTHNRSMNTLVTRHGLQNYIY